MKHPQAPEIFQKPIAAIDMTGLPPRGSPNFAQAVIARYALEYASKGWNAVVTVDDEFVRVVAIPEHGIDPKKYVLGLLQHRYLEDALPILEALYGMLDDAEIAYNYGICLSELGRIDESLKPLERCVHLDHEYTNAYVGLGVAYTRLGRNEDAERALRQAIDQDPENALAKRNLAAVLARSGKGEEALPFFRQAASLAPNDAGAHLGLAQCLDQLGGDHRKEADNVYGEIARRFADHPAAEIAKMARNKIADEQLHDTVDGNVRMDAVFYMQGAMDQFAGKTKQEIGQIVMEIGLLGQGGLQINKPEVRYSLKSLPGDFSGLQLISIMHAGIRLFDQSSDTGTGLDREYELAMAMRRRISACLASGDWNTTMSTMPESYWKIVSPFITTAKGFLENGETLAPIAFIGSFSSDLTIPVLLKSSSAEAKDDSAFAIKNAAATLDADFIFVMMEAWSLRKDKMPQMDAILDKYGSIGASPYAVDVVSMALETRHGIWSAEVPIKPKGISKKKRTIGTPEFRHFTEFEGRFVNLLPVKDGAEKLH